LLVYFLWIEPNYITPRAEELGFEGCIEDAIKQSSKILGEQGGFLNPEFHYLYQGKNIGYLCYTNLYYKPCVVQKPFLKQHFEAELEKATKDKIQRCYENSLDDLKRKGYDVSSGDLDINILLEPNRILIKLEAPVVISREVARGFESFDVVVNSQIYNMLMIATSVLQYETRFGDSDTSSLMIFYPNLIIDKIKRGDGTTLYILEDKNTKDKFQFASRSFVWPPGYGSGSQLIKK
jgi:hypothetical protein